MRKFNTNLLHSASDLNAFLGCPHAISLSLRKLLDPESLPERAADDDEAKLVAEAGNEHERSYRRQLSADELCAFVRMQVPNAAMPSPPWRGEWPAQNLRPCKGRRTPS